MSPDELAALYNGPAAPNPGYETDAGNPYPGEAQYGDLGAQQSQAQQTAWEQSAPWEQQHAPQQQQQPQQQAFDPMAAQQAAAYAQWQTQQHLAQQRAQHNQNLEALRYRQAIAELDGGLGESRRTAALDLPPDPNANYWAWRKGLTVGLVLGGSAMAAVWWIAMRSRGAI